MYVCSGSTAIITKDHGTSDILKNHIEKLRDVSSVHGQTARNCFTLIELLVVITIIMILVPMLLPAPLSTATYHHLAVTFDGDILKTYVDGQLMESLAYSAPLDDSQDGKLLIGVDQDSGGFNQHMFGFIDEVVIFDRGITALEVVDHYSMGRP